MNQERSGESLSCRPLGRTAGPLGGHRSLPPPWLSLDISPVDIWLLLCLPDLSSELPVYSPVLAYPKKTVMLYAFLSRKTDGSFKKKFYIYKKKEAQVQFKLQIDSILVHLI